ncbi:MAG: hypothetical protein ABH983_02965, partial [Candidatus Micrarchaeota archaeon]
DVITVIRKVDWESRILLLEYMFNWKDVSLKERAILYTILSEKLRKRFHKEVERTHLERLRSDRIWTRLSALSSLSEPEFRGKHWEMLKTELALARMFGDTDQRIFVGKTIRELPMELREQVETRIEELKKEFSSPKLEIPPEFEGEHIEMVKSWIRVEQRMWSIKLRNDWRGPRELI